MSKCPAFIVVVGLVMACLGQSVYAAQAAAPVKKKILLLHSYHEAYPWVQAVTRGVQKAMVGSGVELEIFYMDTKRNTSQEFKSAVGKSARDKIDAWKPDAVITSDDNAQIFVAQQYLNKAPYFVFCGVNADPAVYGFPADNVTGIIERPQYGASLEWLKQIVPQVRKIAVVSDDDPTSVGSLTFMQQESDIPLTVLGYKIIGFFPSWQERIEQYNQDADAICIYMYHTIKEKEGAASMLPSDVMAWTIAHCSLPTVGMFDFAIEDGVLCGVVESGEEHGQEAALMALGLIKGESIAKFPVKKAEIGVKMINLKTARKLGLIVTEEVLRCADKIIE